MTSSDVNTSQKVGEGKYSSLLKPIKELASNWNIDIASELLEYLDTLDSIEICFDETGESKLNFAEAALLIQGSTMVYSKKVEFLYNLVYKTLDLLCDESEQLNSSGQTQRRKTRNGINDEDQYKADMENFLLLDDVVPLANAKSSITLTLPTTKDEKKVVKQRGLKQPFPHAFMAGRSDISLAENSQSLKLMTCGVYNGTVMLDDSTLLKQLQVRRSNNAFETQEKALKPPDSTPMKDGNNDDYDDGDDFGDYGGDYDDGADSLDGYQNSAAHAMISPEGGNNLVNMDQNFSEDEEEEEEDHFWDKLDPHDTSQLPNRPFKRGKTWLIPKRLKKMEKNGDVEEEEEIDEDDIELEASVISMANSSNPNPKRSLLYPEFMYFLSFQRSLERKSKMAREKLINQQAYNNRERERLSLANEHNVAEYEDDDGEYDNGGMDDDMYDDYGGGGDMDSLGDEDMQTHDVARKLDVDSIAVDSAPNSYIDLVRKHVQSYLQEANEWALETNLHQRVREWQERVEPILLEQDNRPAFDIHEYGGKILQGLDKQDAEKQENTDGEPVAHSLHKFEDILLSTQSATGANDEEKTEPRKIERFEVCRLFLASLQLANNGNVKLQHSSNESDLELVIVDEVLANAKLQGYLAPSVSNANQNRETNSGMEQDENQQQNVVSVNADVVPSKKTQKMKGKKKRARA